MNTNISHLARLPLEVVLEISAYLSPEDLIRCAAASQTWYSTFIPTIADWYGRRLIENVRYWRSDSIELVASYMSGFAVLFIQSMECHPSAHITIHGLTYSGWRQLENYALADQLNAIEHLSAANPECLPMIALTNIFVHSKRLRHFTLSVESELMDGCILGDRGPHVVFSWFEWNVSTYLTHITITLSPSRRSSASRFELVAEDLALVSPFLIYLDVNFARVLHRTFFSEFLVPPSRSLRTCLFTPLDTREYLIHSQQQRKDKDGSTVLGYSLPSATFAIRPWTILLQSYACTLTRLYLEGKRVWYGLSECEFPSLEELMLRVMIAAEDDCSICTDEDSSVDEPMEDAMMDISDDDHDDSSPTTPGGILAAFLAHSPQLRTLIIRSDKIYPPLDDIYITDHVLETLSKYCRKLDYLCISGGSLGRFSSYGLYRFARDSGRRLRVLELDCTGTREWPRQQIDLGNLLLMAKHLCYFELRHICTVRRRCRLYGQCASILSGRPGCRFFERTKNNEYSTWPFTPRIPVDRLFVSSTPIVLK